MIDFHKGFKEYERLGENKPVEEKKEVSLSKEEKVESSLNAAGSDFQTEDLYQEARSFVRSQFELVRRDNEKNIDFKGISRVADKICDAFERSKIAGGYIKLFFEHDEYEDNYIYSHSVNVCFLCLKVAMELNFSAKRMRETAISALFHDIGMMKVPVDVWNREGALSDAEYKQVQEHPLLGEGLFTNVKDYSETIPLVIGQHQEKVDGAGYPGRLKSDDIHYIARLLSLVDNYETQTHSRKWKKKALPDRVIQGVLDNETGKFDPHFMKALLKVVSIYPEGSFVKISSGEICKVVETNKDKPMRPVVTMVYDNSRNFISSQKLLDLSKQMLVHVVKCIDPNEI